MAQRKKSSNTIPLITLIIIADAIAAVDRIISGLNAQKLHFVTKKNAKLCQFRENNSFWRPIMAMRP
jgi:hypothetical protein